MLCPGRSSDSSSAAGLGGRPQVSPTTRLRVAADACEFAACAVVYNDGGHWWADMLCHGRFRRRNGEPRGWGSYRYDGLEADGKLRYAAAKLTLTSDPRHISVVLYRKRA